jgi:hypothetical protein
MKKRLKIEDVLLEKITELEAELRQARHARNTYVGLLTEIFDENRHLTDSLDEKMEKQLEAEGIADFESARLIRQELRAIVRDIFNDNE